MRVMAVMFGIASLIAFAATVPEVRSVVTSTKVLDVPIVDGAHPVPLPEIDNGAAAYAPDVLYDLEGREINPALAQYSIDRRGNLYEVHSPRTEVPRIGPPTT